MHGSPLSKYDNKKIWEKFDYRDYGIIADPAFDIDYDEVFYISDTGRAWNNSTASVRDKVIRTEARGRRAEVGRRRTDDGRRMTEARGRRSAVRGPERQQFDIKIKNTFDLIKKV